MAIKLTPQVLLYGNKMEQDTAGRDALSAKFIIREKEENLNGNFTEAWQHTAHGSRIH